MIDGHVRRLDIAVDNTLAVRFRERFPDLPNDLNSSRQGEPFGEHQLAKGLSLTSSMTM
jgi:hypothetical protein